MHKIALLRRENEKLREINHVLSKRRRIKNKRLQTEGPLTIIEAQKLRAVRDDDEMQNDDEDESSRPTKRARAEQRRCDICGRTEHNARICQTKVEISNEDDFDCI